MIKITAMRRRDHSGLKFKLLLACVAFGYLLALGMSVSPALHDLIHHDAGESSHHCMATVVSNGLVDSPTLTPLEVHPPSLPMGSTVLLFARQEWPLFRAGFALEHAPPVG